MIATEACPGRLIPWDVRCKGCGGWIASASGDARWIRARCINRRCPKYGQPQEVKRPNDSQ